MLSLVGDVGLYTVLPLHTQEAGISLGSVGIILSVNRIVRLLMNSVAGAAYDRSRRRPLFLGSLLVGALATVLYAIKPGFLPLFCGRILWGIAWSGIWVGGATIILDITNHENRGRWTGFYQTWFYMGGVLGAIISGVGTDWLGFTSMLWLAAILGAAGWFASFVFLPETRLSRADDETVERSNEKNNYLSNASIWVAAILQGMNRFAVAGVLAATMALLVKDYIMTTEMVVGVATLTGLISGLRMIVSMTASPLIGIISDRTGNRWKSIWVISLLSALSMYLIGMERASLILIGLFLASITSGCLQTLAIAVVGDVAMPAQRGKAIGLLHTCGDLGSALGPIAAYAVLPWIGLSGVFTVCGVLFIAVIPVTIWQKNKSF